MCIVDGGGNIYGDVIDNRFVGVGDAKQSGIESAPKKLPFLLRQVDLYRIVPFDLSIGL